MVKIRPASLSDEDQMFQLASAFATSFRPEQRAFDASFHNLLRVDSALLLVAEDAGSLVGYLLGFDHETFFANGRVTWTEELMVVEPRRREGIGRALVQALEDWARSRSSKLVALATRRAASFYALLGYEESATYFRKLLDG